MASSLVYRNTYGRIAVHPTKYAYLRARTASLSSYSMHKCWVVEELAYGWQRAGQTKLLKSSASLTGFPTTSWSSARWFSPSSLYMLQSEPTWSWRKTLLWQAAIHYYYGLILIPIGDWNDHISAAISVYSNAHGGQDFSTCNSEIEDSGICNSQWSLHHQHLVQEERLTSNHLKLSWPFNPSKLYFIATASAVQSAMWKSSLTRSASNSTT